MNWTPTMDRQLLAARAAEQKERSGPIEDEEAAANLHKVPVPAAAVAARLSSQGFVVTEDQVRNRLRRLDRARQNQDAAPAEPVRPETPLDDITVAQGTFVGFRMGFFDFETTDLKALMGRLLVFSVTDNFGEIITRTIYDFPQKSIIDDRGLAVFARDTLETFDILVGWNSKMFDISMLNARLMRWGERPARFDIMHLDPMYKARAGANGIRIGSSKLVNVDKFFNRNDPNEVHKTDIDWDIWALAGAGDKDSMDYIVEHCEADVLVLRSVFNHLKPLIRTIHR